LSLSLHVEETQVLASKVLVSITKTALTLTLEPISERPASIRARFHPPLEFYNPLFNPPRRNALPSPPESGLDIRPTNPLLLIERVLATLLFRNASRPALIDRSKPPFFLILAQILPIGARSHHLRHDELDENVAVAERVGDLLKKTTCQKNL
jgi:hypothetical protein